MKETPGQRFARELKAEYDFEQQESQLVRLISVQLDRIDELDRIVEAEGLTHASPHGTRLHPAAIESRQLSLSVARLIATLRLPYGLDEEAPGRVPQRRGAVRGVYRRVKRVRRHGPPRRPPEPLPEWAVDFDPSTWCRDSDADAGPPRDGVDEWFAQLAGRNRWAAARRQWWESHGYSPLEGLRAARARRYH